MARSRGPPSRRWYCRDGFEPAAALPHSSNRENARRLTPRGIRFLCAPRPRSRRLPSSWARTAAAHAIATASAATASVRDGADHQPFVRHPHGRHEEGRQVRRPRGGAGRVPPPSARHGRHDGRRLLGDDQPRRCGAPGCSQVRCQDDDGALEQPDAGDALDDPLGAAPGPPPSPRTAVSHGLPRRYFRRVSTPFFFFPLSLLTRPPLSFSQVVAGMKYTITMEMSDGSHHRVQIVDQAWSTPRYTMLADEIVQSTPAFPTVQTTE